MIGGGVFQFRKIKRMKSKPNRLAVALANLKAHPKRIDVLVQCNRLNAARLAQVPRSTPLTQQPGEQAS